MMPRWPKDPVALADFQSFPASEPPGMGHATSRPAGPEITPTLDEPAAQSGRSTWQV
jgi:hypothetical protein